MNQSNPHIKFARLMGAISLLFLFSGCADSVDSSMVALLPKVGFFHGFWHGILLPWAFLVSLFDPHTAIYATYNNGGWYNFGFVLGVSSFAGGASMR